MINNDAMVKQTQNEILQMKSDTLTVYGKRAEMALVMRRKLRVKLACKKIVKQRIEKALDEHNVNAKKLRKLKKILPRVNATIVMYEQQLEKLNHVVTTMINDVKMQREAIGMYDHTILEDIYDKIDRGEMDDIK